MTLSFHTRDIRERSAFLAPWVKPMATKIELLRSSGGTLSRLILFAVKDELEFFAQLLSVAALFEGNESAVSDVFQSLTNHRPVNRRVAERAPFAVVSVGIELESLDVQLDNRRAESFDPFFRRGVTNVIAHVVVRTEPFVVNRLDEVGEDVRHAPEVVPDVFKANDNVVLFRDGDQRFQCAADGWGISLFGFYHHEAFYCLWLRS